MILKTLNWLVGTLQSGFCALISSVIILLLFPNFLNLNEVAGLLCYFPCPPAHALPEKESEELTLRFVSHISTFLRLGL